VSTLLQTRGGRPPSPAQLAAAYGRRVPDLLAAGLDTLLVGINPSLYSAAVGRHFARPGNRLWRTLFESALTPALLAPEQTDELVAAGFGITNLVARATARADELTPAELRAGVPRLRRLVGRWRPGRVCVLGLGAYRIAFAAPAAGVGRQPADLAGRPVWVLPNPSGRAAHYQQAELNRLYARLHDR
jgi:TDG/mug DNA glycosylase family protein